MVIHGQEQYTFGRKEIDMRKYVIIDKTSGQVLQVMEWGDDRDFPSDYPLEENQKIVTVSELIEVDLDNVYDDTTGLFYVLEPVIVPQKKTEVEILQKEQTRQENRLSQIAIDNVTFQEFVLETIGGK